jgi:hypothetical protein
VVVVADVVTVLNEVKVSVRVEVLNEVMVVLTGSGRITVIVWIVVVEVTVVVDGSAVKVVTVVDVSTAVVVEVVVPVQTMALWIKSVEPGAGSWRLALGDRLRTVGAGIPVPTGLNPAGAGIVLVVASVVVSSDKSVVVVISVMTVCTVA